jgi:hypothetical protein
MRGGAILLMVAGVGILAARAARAGCQNACSATAEPMAVTPPLDCATFQALPQTCDCALLVSVVNGCPAALQATGFTWSSCQTAAGAGAANCVAVEPGGRGSLFLKVNTPGRSAWSLELAAGDGTHTVDVALQVTSFDHGGCAIASTSHEPAWIAVTALLAGLAGRRATRRRLGTRSGGGLQFESAACRSGRRS